MKNFFTKSAAGIAAVAFAMVGTAVPALAAGTTSTTGGVSANTLILPALANNNDFDLGDLFVLDRLFGNDGGIFTGGNNTSLGDLFILDQLFNGNGGFGGGIFNGNDSNTSLGDLFIFDQLFGDSGDVGFGDLFVLDRLFGDDSAIFD